MAWKPTNRVRAMTRWPLDKLERIEAASTDMDFVTAMKRIMRPSKGSLGLVTLNQLERAAYGVLDAIAATDLERIRRIDCEEDK